MTIDVGVDGFARGGQNNILLGKRIWVESNKNAPNPILDEEVANKIKRGLELKGYGIASSEAETDLKLEYVYGIDMGKEVTSSGTSHQLNVFTGQFDQVTSVSSGTVFTRQLTLRVFDGSDRTKPAWVGEAISRGSKSQLRVIIDYLVAAACEHIGQNTSERAPHVYDYPSDPLRLAIPAPASK